MSQLFSGKDNHLKRKIIILKATLVFLQEMYKMPHTTVATIISKVTMSYVFSLSKHNISQLHSAAMS